MNQVYIHTEDVHNMAAPREIVPLVMQLVKPSSVLDVGCGIGTWLKGFEESGVQDFMGIDGDYVQRAQLKIGLDRFKAVDLTTPWTLSRKFDLVVCLEVAEHLPEKNADSFVQALTQHGHCILFSAAIPGQGGQHHINEQWPEYWQQKFAKHGFYFHDPLRAQLWLNNKIDWWYRQNIFLITRDKTHASALPLIHPELFKQKLDNAIAYQDSLTTGKQGLRLSTRIFLNSLIFKLKKLFR